MKLSESMIFCH